MAINPENLLGTTPETATPDQLAAVKQYADLLAKGATSDQPIINPLQGVAQMAKALALRNTLGQVGQQEMAGRNYAARSMPQDPLAGMEQSSATGSPQSGASQAPSQAETPQSGGYGGLPSQAVDAIRKQEGYAPRAQWDVHQYTYGYGSKAPGPGAVATRSQSEELLNRDLSQAAALVDQVNPRLDPGTRAALTDLTFNTGIGWSKQGLGQAVRAGDLQGIKQGLLQYQNVAGRPNPVIANRRQMDAGWIGQPGAQVAQAGPALGGVGAPPPNAPSALAGALAGPQVAQASPQGQQVAAGRGAAPTVPGGPMPTEAMPQQGPNGSMLQPGMVPHRVPVTYEQMIRANASPWLSPEQKKMVTDMYYAQSQPQQFQSPYGTVLVDPRGNQQFIGKAEDYETKSGDTSYKQPFQYLLDDKGQPYRRPVPTQQPPAAPTEPAPPAPNKFDLNKPTSTPKPQSTAEPPVGGSPGVAAAESGKPVRVASLGNIIGPVSESPKSPVPPGPQPPTMLTQPPPGASGTQTAQYVDPYTKGTINELQDIGATGAAKKATAESFAKQYTDDFQAKQGAAQTARNTLPNLELMRRLADDPNFPAGTFANGRLSLQKLQAWLGDNPNAGRAAQAFDKLINGETLEALRTAWSGAGLGQVRLAEFTTLAKSLVSRENSPEAIKALLDVMIKAHQRVADVGELQGLFQDGYRYDANGHFTKSATPGSGLTINDWNKTLQKYIEKNPVITDEDINTLSRFTSKAPPGEETTYTNTQAGKPGPQPPPQDDPLQRAIEERNRRQGK